ncbi:MAG: SRPBCC family protein [Patulibacter sp.]
MDELRAEVTIERQPDEIYRYLVDVANYPEFCDHFLVDWHLTREDTIGVGAGVRFRIEGRDRFGWGDMTIVEAQPPRLIVARGRSSRFNRIRTVYEWTLTPSATGTTTTVSLSVQRDAQAPFDRIRDALGGRWVEQRRWRRALGRLEGVIERGEGHGKRVTLSGGPRKPATGSPLR